MRRDLLSDLTAYPVTGATMTVATVRPDLRPGDRWRAARGLAADLYVLSGRHAIHHCPAVYVGITADLDGQRPAVSLRRWALQTGLLRAERVALIRLLTRPTRPELELIEKRLVRGANAFGIIGLNTVTGAPAATRQLGKRAGAVAAHGDALLADVRRLVLGGARGALTIPATTASETAVRAVLDAGGPVDTPTVVALLQAIAPRHGVTPAASVRRDLTVLEQRTAGVPRVRVLHHDRRAYFYPAHLNRADVMKEVAGW
ncbi:hypothetical protein [Cellulomonas sp. P24]|uniref:hypothetical protein n=1 Tax=Cellulomonas sp. P24 TaxID=2885206 RepID=UPI00216B2BDE|nr:hypothetical protein [Cellulomonas sp. P24]MCR6491145.1 hypothetical protein [Cellulomonas sp. P24]